jgi:hypothetical protein
MHNITITVTEDELTTLAEAMAQATLGAELAYDFTPTSYTYATITTCRKAA